MGVFATVAPRGLGPQDPTKKLAQWVDLWGQPLSRKHVFEIFGPKPPLKGKFAVLISTRKTQQWAVNHLNTTHRWPNNL